MKKQFGITGNDVKQPSVRRSIYQCELKEQVLLKLYTTYHRQIKFLSKSGAFKNRKLLIINEKSNLLTKLLNAKQNPLYVCGTGQSHLPVLVYIKIF